MHRRKANQQPLFFGVAQKLRLRNTAAKIQKTNQFKPHLTLGRIKSVSRKCPPIEQLLSNYENYFGGDFSLNQIELIQSVLSQQGPVYSTLDVFDMVGEKA